jgi:hypothetical protein
MWKLRKCPFHNKLITSDQNRIIFLLLQNEIILEDGKRWVNLVIKYLPSESTFSLHNLNTGSDYNWREINSLLPNVSRVKFKHAATKDKHGLVKFHICE